jgi:hypothetical protein
MTPCGFDLALAQHYIANDLCACEYIKFRTPNFGAIVEELFVVVEIDFLSRLILFFY